MSRREALLVIDVGLTNCKTTLYDLRAQPLAQAAERYPTRSPAPGLSEQQPNEWLAAAQAALARMADATAHTDILAIIVTGHMHGLVGLDAGGRPVAPCWTLFDQRATGEAQALCAAVPDAYAITGARLEAYTPAAKILWMRRNLPALHAGVRAFVAPKDALRVALGGDLCTDPIDAAGMLLVDLESGNWSPVLLQAVGSPPVPEIRAPWTPAGCLSAEAAARLGLRAGTPLLTGAGDDIEALGAGLVEAGQTLEHLGTTGTLVTCTDRPLRDPAQRLEAYPHVVPGCYLVGGATNAAGLSLDWAARLLGVADAHGRLPLAVEDGALLPPVYLPWIRGERGLLWNPHASGAWVGLNATHTTADLARAVYDGVACSIYEILDAISALGAPAGLQVDAVVSGTPLDDPTWARLRSSLYGRPLLYPAARDLTGLGCALVGLVGLGAFDDLRQAVAVCCRLEARVEPDAQMAQNMATRFARYGRVARSYAAVEAALTAGEPLLAAQEG